MDCNAITYGHFSRSTCERTDHAAEAVIVVPDDEGKVASHRENTSKTIPMVREEAMNLGDQSDPAGE